MEYSPVVLVKVIKTPAGRAPKEIRQCWVGLTLPVRGFAEPGHQVYEIITHQPITREKWNVAVSQVEAIKILSKRYPEAAQWWRNNGYPRGRDWIFLFYADELELVDCSKAIEFFNN